MASSTKGGTGRHQSLSPGEERGLIADRPQPQPLDHLWSRHRGARVGQTALIPLEESVGEPLGVAGPSALTRHQANRSDEPDEIDNRRALGRVIEVIQTKGRVREGGPLQMCIAVEAHRRHLLHGRAELAADSAHPGPVHEPEEGVWILAQQGQKLGWELVGSDRKPAVRRRGSGLRCCARSERHAREPQRNDYTTDEAEGRHQHSSTAGAAGVSVSRSRGSRPPTGLRFSSVSNLAEVWRLVG